MQGQVFAIILRDDLRIPAKSSGAGPSHIALQFRGFHRFRALYPDSSRFDVDAGIRTGSAFAISGQTVLAIVTIVPLCAALVAFEAYERLNQRQAAYVKGIVAGKSKYRAAMDAGYAESTAKTAKYLIEGPDVRAAFREMVRIAISAEKIVRRIAEGLDAKETRFFQFQGGVTAKREVIDWKERRKYAELAAIYGGYLIEPKEVEVRHTDDDIDRRLAELFTEALESASNRPLLRG